MKLLQIHDKKLLNQQKINVSKKIVRQQGAALIILMLVLILSAVTYLVSGLDSSTVTLNREKQTQAALAEAKAALIGDAVKWDLSTKSNTLPNPDMDYKIASYHEGDESPTTGGSDANVIGKLPWRSLGIEAVKDGWGECLWYVVSGRFKRNPATSTLNWDTQGQIDVIDEKGNKLATNLAAIVISSGPILSGQDRSSGQAVYPQCGGNYDAKNSLDTSTASNAIFGEVNYYAGSQNNSVAPDSSNKIFVLAKTANYNDRFAFITVDDIFNRVMKRLDFSQEVNTLLSKFADPKVSAVVSSNTCSSTDFFCINWIGMVFVKDYTNTNPASVKLTGVANSLSCSRVIIFGGKKNAASQYLDAQNYQSFNYSGNSYQGAVSFDPSNPTQDVIKCIP